MDFQQTWQKQIQERLDRFSASARAQFQQAAPNLLYGFLSGMTLWPVAEAMRGGDLAGPILALGGIVGNVGANLIANQVQNWKDEADAAEQLSQAAQSDPGVREVLDVLLDKLKVVEQAQAGMSDQDRDWFMETLRREVAQLESSLTVVTVPGSGAAAVGGQATSAGKGGVAVGGDVIYGDKVGRDKVAGDKVEISTHVRDVHGSTVITAGRDVTYMTASEKEALNDYLAHAVAAYEARMYQHLAPHAAPPDQPYKFLYAFEIEDADIFFGRDAASEAFHQAILKDRLTVLHAKSGAGKTSLLNAGLSPRLIREGYLPVYARSYEDPVLAIKRAIAPPSLGPWPELLPKLTLHEFLGLTCAHLSRQTRELVVILDQFEEFFVFWPERDHRQPFIDALADCYDDRSLPVRFIIALRKDYYSDLADFEERIRNVFHNQHRLDTMTRQEARAAVTRPVAKLGRPVTYEQDLLDTLLNDLARGGMEPPHLQIICTRLYEALAENETIINLASYEELGRAEGVLGGYLNDVLNRLPGRGEAIAREVLKELVSSEATRRVLSYDMLAVRLEAEEDELDGVLAQLVDARLLRRDEVADEITYEMAHEYLIEEIRTWIDQSDLAFKQAEELLAREVMNWRVYGTLIPRERLELLHAQRGRLSGLDDEMWECILRSAMQADFAVEDWAELTDEVGESLFLATLDDPQEDIRWAATRGLGRIWGLLEVSELGDKSSMVRETGAEALGQIGNPRTVEPLIAALRDKDTGVRGAAAKALGHIGDPRTVEPLIAALRDEDTGVRGAAAEALGQIGDPRTVEPLIAALRDEDSNVRRVAAWALGKIGDSQAVEPLIAALRNEDGNMRRVAAWALGKIGDSRAVEPLIAVLEDQATKNWWRYSVREAAAEALGRIGEPAVEPLIAALQDEDSNMRQGAAGALGRIGEPAVEPLIAALRDENSGVCRAAAQALKKIGTPKALAVLEEWRRYGL